jgi:hypothetical protein
MMLLIREREDQTLSSLLKRWSALFFKRSILPSSADGKRKRFKVYL